jgi:hypothetical protein
MIPLLALSLVLAPQGRSLYDQVVTIPNANNGYEEYLRAADILNDKLARLYYGWRPGQSKPDSPGQEIATSLAGKNYLFVQGAMVERYGRALDLVRAGNAKAAWDPRKAEAIYLGFPQLDGFRGIVQLLCAEAYVRFAKGDSAGGTDDLLAGSTFDRAIGNDDVVQYLVGYGFDQIIFGSLSKSLPCMSELDAQRLIAYVSERKEDEFMRLIRNDMKRELDRIGKAIHDPEKEYLVGSDYAPRPSLRAFLGKLTPAQKAAAVSRVKAEVAVAGDLLLQRLQGPESQWFVKRPAQDIEPDPRIESEDDLVRFLTREFKPLDFSGTVLRWRTELRLLRLHGRVIAFRWRHDRLPRNLAEATGKDETADPVNGEEFVFEPQANQQYRLYS